LVKDLLSPSWINEVDPASKPANKWAMQDATTTKSS